MRSRISAWRDRRVIAVLHQLEGGVRSIDATEQVHGVMRRHIGIEIAWRMRTGHGTWIGPFISRWCHPSSISARVIG